MKAAPERTGRKPSSCDGGGAAPENNDASSGDEDDEPEHPVRGRKLPTAAVCKRYGISRRALCRWMTDPKSGLPASILLAGRHYWSEADLIAWERANIVKKVA